MRGAGLLSTELTEIAVQKGACRHPKDMEAASSR